MAQTEATVVVPTRDRPQGLARLLAGLARQTDPGVSWDVLVVDNGGSRGARWLLRAAGLPGRVVREPTPGVSAARNRGVAEVTAPLTVLLDDDVAPADDWLRRLLAPVRAGRFGAAGGRVVLDPRVALPGWMDETLAGFVTALDLGPATRVLVDDEYVLGANAVFPTELLAELGFARRLGPRPGAHLTNDDMDLVWRAREAGVRVGWVPDAVVVHDAPAERLLLSWLARRSYEQGRSDWLIAAQDLRETRLGGLRPGWWYLRDRIGHWHAHADSWGRFGAHVLSEVGRTVGFWREALTHTWRRLGRPARPQGRA